MTQDEAKDVLLNNVEKEARHEAALIIRDIESKAKAEADRRAVNIIQWRFSAAQRIMLRNPPFPLWLCPTTK